MRSIKVLALFGSAFLLSASMLSGCSDHNNGYTEVRTTEAVTTAEKTTEPTAATQETTQKTTKTKKNKTTAAAKETSESQKTTSKEKRSQKKTTSADDSSKTTETTAVFDFDDGTYAEYHFRSKKLLNQHFEKHGAEFDEDFGYKTAEEYEKGASDVINNKEALHKTEAEDGDGVYYIEATNEFVILSTDGYIRTYFRPNGGKSYYDRQ